MDYPHLRPGIVVLLANFCVHMLQRSVMLILSIGERMQILSLDCVYCKVCVIVEIESTKMD
jgi:hypothetical protein